MFVSIKRSVQWLGQQGLFPRAPVMRSLPLHAVGRHPRSCLAERRTRHGLGARPTSGCKGCIGQGPEGSVSQPAGSTLHLNIKAKPLDDLRAGHRACHRSQSHGGPARHGCHARRSASSPTATWHGQTHVAWYDVAKAKKLLAGPATGWPHHQGHHLDHPFVKVLEGLRGSATGRHRARRSAE